MRAFVRPRTSAHVCCTHERQLDAEMYAFRRAAERDRRSYRRRCRQSARRQRLSLLHARDRTGSRVCERPRRANGRGSRAISKVRADKNARRDARDRAHRDRSSARPHDATRRDATRRDATRRDAGRRDATRHDTMRCDATER